MSSGTNIVGFSQTRPRDPWAPDFSAVFGTFLRERGTVGAEPCRRAERAARETGERFDLVLVRLGLASEADMASATADYLQLPLLAATDVPSRPVPVAGLEAGFLKRGQCLPLRDEGEHLVVAVADPFEADAAGALAFKIGRPVHLVVAAPRDLARAFEQMEAADLDAQVSSPRTRLEDVAGAETASEDDVRRLTDLASEAPVVRVVHDTIQRAVECDASDIHLEPGEGGLIVRYRIDGELDRAIMLPTHLASAIISRIKIMARLNIAEQRMPQDGRMNIAVRGRDVELRVSSMPTLRGESIVLRILDRNRIALDFNVLGFSGPILDAFLSLLDQPNGLILVTGPTGSGKSTTLYTALSRLNQPRRKVFTIEDPVETDLAGVAQVQVRPKIGLSFAHALRSILRQDPDVIMVGEIRDLETAQMAMQASLTGHLVLSTLHTNSAAATVTRLVDMGLEPYMVASTLKAALAQRLVRCLCPACARPAQPTAALKAVVDHLNACGQSRAVDFGGLREPVGCPACRRTGYRGRIAVAELLTVDDGVADALAGRGGQAAVLSAAQKADFRPMLADGIDKVCAGVTTLDEVLRVSRGL